MVAAGKARRSEKSRERKEKKEIEIVYKYSRILRKKNKPQYQRKRKKLIRVENGERRMKNENLR